MSTTYIIQEVSKVKQTKIFVLFFWAFYKFVQIELYTKVILKFFLELFELKYFFIEIDTWKLKKKNIIAVTAVNVYIMQLNKNRGFVETVLVYTLFFNKIKK